MVNGVINGINFMIKALNKLKFDVPDWVPLIGGKTFGFSIPTMNNISIPRLATGTVLPGGNPYMAIVNDQPSGQTNVETPVNVIGDEVRSAMSEIGGVGENKQVISLLEDLISVIQNKDTSVNIDGKALNNRLKAIDNQQGITNISPNFAYSS